MTSHENQSLYSVEKIAIYVDRWRNRELIKGEFRSTAEREVTVPSGFFYHQVDLQSGTRGLS